VIVFSPAAIPIHAERATQAPQFASRLEREETAGFEPGGTLVADPTPDRLELPRCRP
jgi:hypothetical protein